MFTRIPVSRAALLNRAGLLLAAAGALCAAPQAHAQVYLVGAEQFAADANGTTATKDFQSDTNSSNGITRLGVTVNGVTNNQDIAFALSNGSNPISFTAAPLSPTFSAYGGSDGDLGLFFSSTNTSYDPSSAARTPDLLVARATDGSTAFFIPTAGTSINDYVFNGLTTYSGAASFTVGTVPITVTQYSVADDTTGTLTLQLGAVPASVPEPGSVALLAGIGVAGARFLSRRRRQSVRKAV